MRVANPFDHAALALQVRRQKKHAWDLEKAIPWDTSIQTNKPLLPLDEDAIAFPGASAEQRLALSQLSGLIINSTIAEMENVIHGMKSTGWEKILKSYPVNPELWELGELFFLEEAKHALAFERYNELFCNAMGIDPEDLARLVPKAYGSLFLKAISLNAQLGGHAFWWVVGSVEEVSLLFYRQLHESRQNVDPLYYIVHQKHMEEEARHHNYAFLMLELIEQKRATFHKIFHRSTDLLLSQVFSTTWIVAELHKIFTARELRKKNPFFEVLASALPLLEKMSYVELAKKLFISAPYVSLMINTKNHPLTFQTAKNHGIPRLPLPDPKAKSTLIAA